MLSADIDMKSVTAEQMGADSARLKGQLATLQNDAAEPARTQAERAIGSLQAG